MAWFMDLSLFGMRVQDVVRSVDYVLSRPDCLKKSVRLIGQGMGALWSLYAAALDLRIESTICDGGLLSYRSLTRVDRYLHGANIFIRDSLLRFDLPQVAAAVVDRRLTLLSPVDHMLEPVRLSLARDTYQWTQETYDRATVSDRFLVARHNQEQPLADQYLSLLESASV
jgi:pimeloyl-ACP methyl ester carboxylesterase